MFSDHLTESTNDATTIQDNNTMMFINQNKYRTEVGEILLCGKDYENIVEGLIKPKARAIPTDIDFTIFQLEKLSIEAPNFSDYIELVMAQLKLHITFGITKPFTLVPTLLVGPPGEGKTYVSRKIAEALDISFGDITLSSATEAFVLSGCPKGYSSAYPGDIAIRLSKSWAINPIILLDEIDKASFYTYGRASILGPLLKLLEHDTAKYFEDSCLKMEIDASHCSWIATANDISAIPDPILSRFHIIHTTEADEKLKSQQLHSLLLKLLNELQLEDKFQVELHSSLINSFIHLPIREWRIKLKLAIAKKFLSEKSTSLSINKNDFEALNTHQEKQPIGFISSKNL